jgi:membrane protease YdiL (CAAX protease family)
LNKRGIFSFLFITFGITYGVETFMLLLGARLDGIPHPIAQYMVAVLMWSPALATVVVTRWIAPEPLKASTLLRMGSWRPYLYSAIYIPLLFFIVYLLTWLLGLGQPDWQLEHLGQQMAEWGVPVQDTPPPAVILSVLLVTSLLTGPFFNGLVAFGEELGWRGYLLPRLMPLGKRRAYLLVGVIWGLWHAPLVLMGFNYPGYPLLGVIFMCGLTTSIGLLINEAALSHSSSPLAGWMHGVFNSQAYGVWRILFPQVNPLLGGMTGLVGIGVWAAAGWWAIRRNASKGLPEDGGISLG